MAVHIEVSLVAVQALADQIRHPADGQQIRSAIERQAVVYTQPLPTLDLVAKRQQARIVKYRRHEEGRFPEILFPKYVGRPEYKEYHADIAVHREKGSVDARQIIGPN